MHICLTREMTVISLIIYASLGRYDIMKAHGNYTEFWLMVLDVLYKYIIYHIWFCFLNWCSLLSHVQTINVFPREIYLYQWLQVCVIYPYHDTRIITFHIWAPVFTFQSRTGYFYSQCLIWQALTLASCQREIPCNISSIDTHYSSLLAPPHKT